MESDARFYRRRANEELAAASRAVTEAAKERRLVLADTFLERLKALEASAVAELAFTAPDGAPAFMWSDVRTAERV